MDIVFITKRVLTGSMEKMLIQNRVKEMRKLSGLTAEQVAEKANTSQPQIFRLEKGQRDLSLDWIARLSKALNCKPYELLPLEWQPKATQSIDHHSLTNIGEIIETVEVWLEENNKKLMPKDKALLITTLLEETSELAPEERSAKIIDFTRFLSKTKVS